MKILYPMYTCDMLSEMGHVMSFWRSDSDDVERSPMRLGPSCGNAINDSYLSCYHNERMLNY